MIRKINLVLVFLLLVVTVNALTVEQNKAVDLKHPVRIDDYPSNSIICNITVLAPDNVKVVDYQEMTNDFDEHNYTLNSSQTSKLGIYNYDITCTTGASNKTESFEFEVTPSGRILSISGGIIYLILLLFTVFLFVLSLFGAIKIKGGNGVNFDGSVVNINDLKYVKIFLWVLSYLLLLGIVFVSKGVTQNFLEFDGLNNIFTALYWGLIAGIFPIFVVALMTFVINFLNDKKIRFALERGIPVR